MTETPETEVRLMTEPDFEAFAVVVTNAYPVASDVPAERQRLRVEWAAQSDDPTTHPYAAFREGRLLGGMQLHDYTMTFQSSPEAQPAQIPVGGVGMVAVDLLHKKEHVARDLITFFLDHYRERGMPLGLLYPFRPDFYKQMGFGYGAKMSEYRVRPADLPAQGSKDNLVDLGPEDSEMLLEYYSRYQARTHGMLRRTTREIERKLSQAQNHLIGYRRNGRLHGYLQYQFRSANERNFLINDMEVFECLYDTPEVLMAFLKYLHTQADQIRTIVFWTQEEDFQYLFLDPRNGSDYLMPRIYHASNVQGIGLMYRVLDTELLLRMLSQEGHSFGGQTCRLYLEITDSFLPDNNGTVVVELEGGHIQAVARAEPHRHSSPETDLVIQLDVADFSSLMLGAVGFKTLYTYGLASLSDPEALDRVDRLFRTEARPRCVTAF